ncbi:YerC/YecD family TrpR-related protein [Pseudobacteriovorax antillogorgiicola]|uniref:Trp operon repressor family n=1 Tax=Pseudobacteriovorax antillogorgiicola TaxID=1513793 RepID=A0A1Y6CU83_9BACT|nr:YerC/YecD family TrpR-related protein [Pseudobacteriovorax antillogorgiicola]TCS44617.1 Trp operon repressor family [Pseudobacteriovorax antillogorgiicola]SMF78323.1 Trp operon repressor family [Pseudobacteriovorax antillogorgiicola]
MASQSGKTDDHWNGRFLEELYQSLSLLDGPEEFQAFFDDLCTPAELRSMADRWRVAKQLEKGDSYRTINEQTGVSTTTITRVARSMTYGAKGYRILLDKQKKKDGIS